MWLFGLVLLILQTNAQTTGSLEFQDTNSTCPTWTYYDNVTQVCKCGNVILRIQIVSCTIEDKCPTSGNVCLTGANVAVLFGYCLTQNSKQRDLVVGACPHNHPPHSHITNQYKAPYFEVPNDILQLDSEMCQQLGGYRTGQLCGQCMDGYSPPVYSYYTQCVNCTSGTNNWPKYLAVSLLPTTVFFLIFLIFRFRATSPRLNGYILMCQMATSPLVVRHLVGSQCKNKHYIGTAGDFMLAYFSIWNLDFFRTLYCPFCLHPNATTLQVLSLDYVLAAYPLALIILTYTLVRLHYHNWRLVVLLWRPFISCFARCRRQWDIQNSLLDAFATFLLLSYVKFLSVSFDILQPTFLWNMRHEQQKTMLYYDGTVEYFGGKHLPYAVLAVTVLIVFNFLPILLLCLYPCCCFQRLLNRFHFNNPALHTIMEVFQGGFKDGTQGTLDYRYFASFYLFSRVGLYITMGFSEVSSAYPIRLNTLILVAVLLISCFHPYKEMFYNKLDIFFLLCLTALLTAAWESEDYNTVNASLLGSRIVATPVILILFGYPVCLILCHVWRKSRRLRAGLQRLRAFIRQHEDRQPSTDPLPARVTMTEATPLLQKT